MVAVVAACLPGQCQEFLYYFFSPRQSPFISYENVGIWLYHGDFCSALEKEEEEEEEEVVEEERKDL